MTNVECAWPPSTAQTPRHANRNLSSAAVWDAGCLQSCDGLHVTVLSFVTAEVYLSRRKTGFTLLESLLAGFLALNMQTHSAWASAGTPAPRMSDRGGPASDRGRAPGPRGRGPRASRLPKGQGRWGCSGLLPPCPSGGSGGGHGTHTLQPW